MRDKTIQVIKQKVEQGVKESLAILKNRMKFHEGDFDEMIEVGGLAYLVKSVHAIFADDDRVYSDFEDSTLLKWSLIEEPKDLVLLLLRSLYISAEVD